MFPPMKWVINALNPSAPAPAPHSFTLSHFRAYCGSTSGKSLSTLVLAVNHCSDAKDKTPPNWLMKREFQNVTIHFKRVLSFFIFSTWIRLKHQWQTEVQPSLVCLHHDPESVCAQTHRSQWCHKCLCQISDNPPPPARCSLHPPLPCFCLVPKWKSKKSSNKNKIWLCVFALLRFFKNVFAHNSYVQLLTASFFSHSGLLRFS